MAIPIKQLHLIVLATSNWKSVRFRLMLVKRRIRYDRFMLYRRATGEIVAYVWGIRKLEIAKRLRKRTKVFGISFGCVCTENRDRFITDFRKDNHLIEKNIQ